MCVCMCLCVRICVHVLTYAYICESQRTTWRNQFSPSPMWALRNHWTQVVGLLASACIHWAIWPTHSWFSTAALCLYSSISLPSCLSLLDLVHSVMFRMPYMVHLDFTFSVAVFSSVIQLTFTLTGKRSPLPPPQLLKMLQLSRWQPVLCTKSPGLSEETMLPDTVSHWSNCVPGQPWVASVSQLERKNG